MEKDFPEYIEQTFEVQSFEVDARGYMKPSAIMNICQEAAYLHSAKLGFSYHGLKQLNLAWVLAMARGEIYSCPKWLDKVTVRTWHKGLSGIFAVREFSFRDARTDREMLYITTSWLIINISTRHIQRADRINLDGLEYRLLTHYQGTMRPDAKKIEEPEESAILGEHIVRYSDIDLNQHTNNAKYLDWACDFSELQNSGEYRLKEFTINFFRETKLNDKVVISSAQQLGSKPSCIINGKTYGHLNFIAELKYGWCD
ncbi:MAG: thioesterase [Rikenellaceae bacterium]